MSIDPMAEKYPDKTPYHYVSNNPINKVDPTGMEEESAGGGGGGEKNNTISTGNEAFDSAANRAIQHGMENNVTVKVDVHMVDGKLADGSIYMEGSGKLSYESDKGFSFDPENQLDQKNLTPTTIESGGISAISVYDSELRSKYINDAKRTAKENLGKFDEIVDNASEEEKVMDKAVKDRNNLKKTVRKKLTPGGRALTKAMEQDSKYTTENLKKIYGPGGEKGTNLENRELRRKVTERSGSSNPTLKKFSTFGRIVGWLGLIWGSFSTLKSLYNDPTVENASREIGAWTGGAVGATAGSAIVVGTIVAFGWNPFGWILIAAAIAGSIMGGYLGSKYGEKLIGSELPKYFGTKQMY